MGLFLRKSFRAGPVRFNLSKSGVGISGGMTGLRLGVSPNGKTYVAGGRHGLYFKETQQPAAESQTNFNLETTRKNRAIYKTIIKVTAFCVLLAFIWSWFWYIIGALTLVAIVYRLTAVRAEDKDIARAQTNEKEIRSGIAAQDMPGLLQTIIKAIDTVKSPLRRRIIFLNTYPDIVKTILQDSVISNDESDVLKLYISVLHQNDIHDINVAVFGQVLTQVLEDEIVEEHEEVLINRCIKLFQLQDMAPAINKLIGEYKELETINTRGLTPISPVLSIHDPAPFYYEKPFTLLKTKTTKGEVSLIEDGRGTLLISHNALHTVVDGHKAHKIDSIISIEQEDPSILRLTVSNRKTPIYLKADDPVIIMGIIKKIKRDKA
jgi:hypothetical protein